MAKVIQIELDTSVELEDDDLQAFLRKVERDWGVTTEIVTLCGPAGGAAVVRYTGPTPAVENMVYAEWTGGGMTELERLQEVAFLVHGEE